MNQRIEKFSPFKNNIVYKSGVLFTLLFASIGVYLLIAAHASSPYVSVNADSGAVSGQASKQTDCTGSTDGTCVLFGSSTTVTSGFAWPSGGVSSNRRYLLDQNGNPYLITGDSAWGLSTNLTTSEMATVFSTRHNEGFNVALVAILTDPYTAGVGGDSMTTYDGIAPFTQGSGDGNSGTSFYNLADPNPTYFDRMQQVVSIAAQYGITIMWDPIETGDLLPLLANNGETADYNYGVYLGNLFKNDPNVMWCSGNDFGNYTNSGDDANVQAVVRGIESVAPLSKQAQTVELYNFNNPNTSLLDPSWGSLIDLNQAYTYEDTYATVITGYNQTPTMPVFMGESNYEDENNAGACTDSSDCTPYDLRQENWGTMTSGATGELYGDHCTYGPCGWSQWDTALSDSSAIQTGYMESFFSKIDWWKLVPDQGHTFVTGGYGTYQAQNSYPSTYVSSALASDGSVGVAYFPQGGSITVNMAKMSGSVTAQWYDPANNTYTTINTYQNSGSQNFSTPGNNSAGNPDWVLLLKAS